MGDCDPLHSLFIAFISRIFCAKIANLLAIASPLFEY